MAPKIIILSFWKLLHRYGKRILIFALICATIIGALWYFYNTGSFKTTVSEGVVGTYTERDLPQVLTSLMSKGLVSVDKSGQPQPLLAESWAVADSAKKYRFTIKKGLKWSDGTAVSAEDIDIRIPDVVAVAVDDRVIEFTLGDSFSPFPSLLTKPILKRGTNMGVGPYKIGSVELSSVFLKKVSLTNTEEGLPNVVIRFYPNERTARQALKIGEVQSLLGVSEPDELLTERPFETYSKTNFNKVVTIFFNTEDPILADENFRLALAFGAPSFAGVEEAKTSVATTSWAFNPTVKDYLDNVTQAKNYLGKVKNGRDLTITLVATGSLQDVGEKVVDAWKKLGINATLQVESGIPQNFQALLITQNIPSDPDQYSLWHSTQDKTNISKIALPRVDKALEDGRKEVDIDKRKAIYSDFQKVLLDHAPATFLYYPDTNVTYLKKIKDPLMRIVELQLGSF